MRGGVPCPWKDAEAQDGGGRSLRGPPTSHPTQLAVHHRLPARDPFYFLFRKRFLSELAKLFFPKMLVMRWQMGAFWRESGNRLKHLEIVCPTKIADDVLIMRSPPPPTAFYENFGYTTCLSATLPRPLGYHRDSWFFFFMKVRRKLPPIPMPPNGHFIGQNKGKKSIYYRNFFLLSNTNKTKYLGKIA